MGSKLNAKGNTISNSLMWMAGIITALLCVIWILGNVDPTASLKLDLINYDLNNIQRKISEACNSAEYQGRYNPHIEEGMFSIFDSEICIEAYDIKQCTKVVCNTHVRTQIDLKDLTMIRVIKDEDGNYEIQTE